MLENRITAISAMSPCSLQTMLAKSAASGFLTAVAFAALLHFILPASDRFHLPTMFAALGDLCGVQINGSYAMEPSAQRPGAVPQLISSERLSHVPGKRVSVVRVTFPPGALSPKHYHGGSVTVYVLSGTIRSQLEGMPAATYVPGETFFEPLGSVHLFAENTSTTEPAEVLAVFVHDESATLTTYF